MAKTISATVKVMISYNYCHFEFSKLVEPAEGQELHMVDIDNARIECQMLADKAVEQYKRAKTFEASKTTKENERKRLAAEVAEVHRKPESEWTLFDKAKVKALEDYNFERWHYPYNEDDDLPF